MSIQYPIWRYNVAHTLLLFSEYAYQQELWGIERRSRDPNYVGMGIEVAMESLREDVHWEMDNSQLIGVIFRNEEELEACKAVHIAARDFYEEKGRGLPDEDYFNDPKWQNIIALSRNALRIMLQGDA